MNKLAFAPHLLTALGADDALQEEEHRSENGYAFPSIEYFVDNYFANTVGFNSSYPDEAVVGGWVNAVLQECADAIGEESMLYLQALCDQLNHESNRIYTEYDTKYEGDYKKVCEHEPEWELLTDDNIEDLCDMVRVHVLGEEASKLEKPVTTFDAILIRDRAAAFVAEFGGTLGTQLDLDHRYAYFVVEGTYFAKGEQYLEERFGAPIYVDDRCGENLRSYQGPSKGTMINLSHSARFGLRIRFIAR